MIVCDSDSEILEQVHIFVVSHIIGDYELLTFPGGPSAINQDMFPEWKATFANTYRMIDRNNRVDQIFFIQSFSSLLLKNLYNMYDVSKS